MPPALHSFHPHADADRRLVMVQDERHRYARLYKPQLAMLIGEHRVENDVVGYVVQLDNDNGGVSEITVSTGSIRPAPQPIAFPRPVSA